jgi:hypothetical protein
MRASFAMVTLSALAGLLVALAPALAQQKTVRACQDEWRANRAANQTAGITEKDYVDKCRATAAAPTAAPSKPAAQTTAPAATKPATQTTAPAATKPATVGVAKPTSSAPTATGANQFASEALAKAHCARDTVVWANLGSRIYHFSESRDFGNTKEGAYMCEKDAVGQGIRGAKNEKHP